MSPVILVVISVPPVTVKVSVAPRAVVLPVSALNVANILPPPAPPPVPGLNSPFAAFQVGTSPSA